MTKINLDGGNFIEYESINSPEGKTNILWGECYSDGKSTGKRGDILLVNNEEVKKLILDDYKKKK